MSGSIATASCIEVPKGVHHLEKNGVFIGLLQETIETDDELFLLARIEGHLLEAPYYLASKLQDLIGKRIIVGLFCGKYRAEVSTQ